MIYELFQETKHPYNLRVNRTLRTYSAKTVQHGTEELLFMRPKIRSLFPSNINISETLEISYWKPDNSPCTPFKTLDD